MSTMNSRRKLNDCPKCGKSYILYSSLKTHMVSHVNTILHCSDCDKTFPDEESVTSHVCRKPLSISKDLHALSGNIKNELKKKTLKVYFRHFQCSKCSAKFFKKIDLEQHVSSHTNDSSTYISSSKSDKLPCEGNERLEVLASALSDNNDAFKSEVRAFSVHDHIFSSSYEENLKEVETRKIKIYTSYKKPCTGERSETVSNNNESQRQKYQNQIILCTSAYKCDVKANRHSFHCKKSLMLLPSDLMLQTHEFSYIPYEKLCSIPANNVTTIPDNTLLTYSSPLKEQCKEMELQGQVAAFHQYLHCSRFCEMAEIEKHGVIDCDVSNALSKGKTSEVKSYNDSSIEMFPNTVKYIQSHASLRKKETNNYVSDDNPQTFFSTSPYCSTSITALKAYDCPVCSAFFLDILDLNHHAAMYHKDFQTDQSFLLQVFDSEMFDQYTDDSHSPVDTRIEHTSYKTPVLQNVSVSASGNKVKSKENSRKETLKCPVCAKVFNERKKLLDHKRIHGVKKHSCNVCGKTFRADSYLRGHMAVHSNQRPHPCSKCNKTFKSVTTLKKHEVIHIDERPFKCLICDKSFKRKSALMEHGIIHSSERPFKCKDCEKTFKSSQILKMHLETHTNKDKKEKENYSCTICFKTFTNKRNYKNHLNLHSGNFPYMCDYCAKGFGNKYSLIQHLRSHTGEKPFKCSLCPRRFALKNTLTSHMDIHADVKQYKCAICDMHFTQKKGLYQHMKNHGNARHECAICSRKFIMKCNYIRHMLIHTGERPHQCSVCLKKFKQKEHLKIHMDFHKSEKQYSCAICGKCFTYKTSLKIHRSIHTQEKPFACEKCNKDFRSRGSLLIHVLTHNNEKKFACPDCGKKFKLASSLKVHLKKSEGTFTCQLCKKVFQRRACLYQHKQLHRSGGVNSQKDVLEMQAQKEQVVESINISEVPEDSEDQVQVSITLFNG